MKKTAKIILLILNLIFCLIFLYNFFLFNISLWNLTFILSITISVITQFICLNKFKFRKKLLFILLNIILTFISALIIFLIPGLAFPYSLDINISTFTTLIGLLFIFGNFTIFYTYLMTFVNNLKLKGKPKSSFVKLLVFYPLVVIILETLIMIYTNKA